LLLINEHEDCSLLYKKSSRRIPFQKMSLHYITTYNGDQWYDTYSFLVLQVVEVNVKVESAGPHNVHHNAFYAEEKLLKSELQAVRDCDPLSKRHWIVRDHACCHCLHLF
jgi:hypothetical protein